jgi:hypothetical protein
LVETAWLCSHPDQIEKWALLLALLTPSTSVSTLSFVFFLFFQPQTSWPCCEDWAPAQEGFTNPWACPLQEPSVGSGPRCQ